MHATTTSPPPSMIGTYFTIWRYYQGRFNIRDKYYVKLDSLTTLWERSKQLLVDINWNRILWIISIPLNIYLTWSIHRKDNLKYNNFFCRLVSNWIQERKVFGTDNASENKKGLSEHLHLALYDWGLLLLHNW